ncbi:hypothetical protein [Crenothrix sp.]|uniref:hypothetical protein n=1 Tax=Crenothrix sp. TaxID=3100433 RepID=UPI00374D46C3
MISRLSYTVFISLTIFSTAWAQDPPNFPAQGKHDLPTFSSVDKNSDGLISREEGFSTEDVSKYWDKLDTSLDGNLDKAEFSKLADVVQTEEALKTDHPQEVQQYENGQYISPEEQIERNKREKK